MTREFDPLKSYRTLKANEKMIAYAGFEVKADESSDRREGVVKISSFHRPYGGGYLTLTFMLDQGEKKADTPSRQRFCEDLTEESLRPLLGKDFERLVKVALDSPEHVKGWQVEEINVYFRSIEEREKVVIEEKLIPALETVLPCKFGPVEWWPVSRKSPTAGKEKVRADEISLRALLRKWFGPG